MKNSIILF